MNILHEIKWAYQRVLRGYDDRVYWAFEDYFTQVLPALKDFCQQQLKTENIDLNPKRQEVYKQTLEYISAYENETYEEMWTNKNLSTLLEYVGKNIGTYWD